MISNKRDLSSNAGLIMAQAALNYANDKGWEITVAVCDTLGPGCGGVRPELLRLQKRGTQRDADTDDLTLAA
jgi:hypothetical protein